MAADTVIGVFDRDQLPAALAAVHRAGYGPNARVLQGERGSLNGQLQRAGISDPPEFNGEALPVLVLFAPARVAQAADLLQRSGAIEIHVASRDPNGKAYAPSGWTPPAKAHRRPASGPPATTPNEAADERLSN